MKILVIIPARGGSKRVYNKNIKILGGDPLINWTINIAKNIPEICEIMVSTDDPAIAFVAKKAGACIPWLRPDSLATDTAESADVAIHALNWYEAEHGKVDGILLLQPTSPFRKKSTVIQGIELFIANNKRSVIGVSPVQDHPLWTFKLEKGYLTPFLINNRLRIRSQDLEPAFIVNGGFYLVSPTKLRRHRSFMEKRPIPLIIESPKEALDIDTEWDFKLAELLLNESY